MNLETSFIYDYLIDSKATIKFLAVDGSYIVGQIKQFDEFGFIEIITEEKTKVVVNLNNIITFSKKGVQNEKLDYL